MKYLWLCLSFFCLMAKAQSTYYVSPSGNDANNGTSVSTAWKTIQKAATTVTAGATINILAGTYKERVLPITTGLPNSIITFQNYQTDEVIIDGAGTNGWGIFTLYGPQFIKLQGLHFAQSDSNAGAWQPAIIVGKTSANIEIANCTFTNLWNNHATGILLHGDDTTAAGLHDVKIHDCTFGNANFKMAQGIGVHGNVYACNIYNNSFSQIANQAIGISGSDSTSKKWKYDFARNITISNNAIDNVYNRTPGNYQQAIIISGARNCVIEKNKIHHCDFGINITAYNNFSRTENILVRENLVFNNYLQGLSVGVYNYPSQTGRIVNCNIHHNTFYQNNSLKTGSGEFVFFPFDSSSITHNIFYTNNQNTICYTWFYGIGQQQIKMDYNLFCSPYLNAGNIISSWDGNYSTGLGSFKTITGMDLHSLYADPLFVNSNQTPLPDLHLFNESPAKDAGDAAFAHASDETDVDNQPRIFNNRVDIGADENQQDYAMPNLASSHEVVDNSGFEVYPNPTNEWLMVNSKWLIGNTIEVQNVLGQRINLEVTRLSADNCQLNTEHLSSGIYFLKATDVKGFSQTIKFIKE